MSSKAPHPVDLRRYRPEDREDFVALVTDADLMARMNGPASLERAHALMDGFLAPDADRERYVRAVVDAATGAYVGHAFIAPRADTGEQEIGYIVAPAWQGRGIATAVARTLVRKALVDLGLDRVIATVDVDHPSSIRVIEKAGLERTDQRVDEHGPYHVYEAVRPAAEEA